MALWTDVAVSVPWALLVFMLGTALFVFYRMHPERLSPDVEIDKIVPFFISQQVPTGIAGLIVAAIMVSAMSSTESSMHSVATLWVTDFYGRFRPQASDRSRLWMARLFTLFLGLFGTASAVLLATADMRSIWDFFQSIMGLFVGSLAGLFLLGIFTVRANSSGAVVGVAASIVTLFMVMQYTRIHFLLYAAIGAVTCVGVGYLASLALPGRRQNRDLTVSSGLSEP
jgi:Na+/proline symporter